MECPEFYNPSEFIMNMLSDEQAGGLRRKDSLTAGEDESAYDAADQTSDLVTDKDLKTYELNTVGYWA